MIFDDEFRSLIPPPTREELEQLEANLDADGCRDPLVTWEGILLDGHNRYEICTRLNIEFDTIAIDLDSRDEAKLWIIRNQLGRRNLEPFVKVELALKGKDLIAELARKNLRTSTGGVDPRPLENSPKAAPINTREEIARSAGVSSNTVSRVEEILKKAPEEVKQRLRNGETSIHAAYQEVRAKDSPRHQPLPDQAEMFDEEEDEQEEAPDPPDPAEEFADRWTKIWRDINVFFVSIPRRGGMVNLVKRWPKVRIENAIHVLRDLESTCGRCAAELEEHYR